jgi:flagellar hook protein FlgE
MSFQQGLSGLNATSRNLDVIGNNIANAGTYGAKSSRTEFADVYAGTLGNAGVGSVGMGVSVARVAQQFSQGGITATQNPLDIAINGEGFFALKDSDNADTRSYTRNGQFKVDNQGYIVNDQHKCLLDAAGNKLRVPSAPNQPEATTTMAMSLNLNMNAATITPRAAPAAPIDFNDTSTFTNSTTTTIYDNGGGERAMSYYFQKTAANTWDVYASIDGKSAYSDAGGLPSKIATLVSTSSGTLDGSASTVYDGAGAATNPVALDALPLQLSSLSGYNLKDVTLDLSNATQYASQFGVTSLDVSGHAMGQLSSVSVDAKGFLQATYSNGVTQPFGQIGLTTFDNPQGLQPVGGNAWIATPEAGSPMLGASGEGTRGQLQSGALEESNVDLTAELVNMMIAQRMYQANSQTIKTQDQVLQTLVNMR